VNRGMEPDELDELMMELARKQIRANYRKYLGREYQSKSLDLRIKKLFKEKKEKRMR